MNSYPAKYFVFFLPFLIAICVELFVLPIHQFTFRMWESLAVKRSFGILKGQFYPNMQVRKNEEGDLGYYTPCAIRKDVNWVTDRYGYRKNNAALKRYPIVIVGDSNIAGSSLDQEELLSEVLEKKLGQSVYPLAGERLRALFQHDLIRKNLPEVVILAGIERDIPESLPPLRPKDLRSPSSLEDVLRKIRLNPVLQTIATVFDRIFKANMLNYFRARINRSGPSLRRIDATQECPILFLQGAEANKASSPERVERAVERIKEYSNFMEKKGIRFIFLPIPNKETIHYEQLNTPKPAFLEQLVKKLRELNIEVIDVQKTFDEIYQGTHSMLYHKDDTHWNALGAKTTANLLESQIRSKPTLISR
jgi:alginate O-acetyltransferase complex protein AlgJ